VVFYSNGGGAMSEDKIKKLLVAGEEVILCDSASIDYRQGKLVLTSKRLFFCGAKSTFNRDYVIKKEVELKDIAKVSGDITGGASILGVAGARATYQRFYGCLGFQSSTGNVNDQSY
jgi:hypothetical protein